MKLSSSTAELFAARALAQAEIRNPRKTLETENEKGEKFKTAALSKFFDNVRLKFQKHNLFFSQSLTSTITPELKSISVSTFVGHSSGQWMETEYFEVPFENDEIGLATYTAKKASFEAAMGITGRNVVETVKPEKGTSQFTSAEERREAKGELLEDIKSVISESAMKLFMDLHKDTIEKFMMEDPDYISDVSREIKRLNNKFAAERDSMKGKL